jgi:hypothetical protein
LEDDVPVKAATQRLAYPVSYPGNVDFLLSVDPVASDPLRPSGHIFGFGSEVEHDYFFAGGEYAFTVSRLILRIQHFKEKSMQYAFMRDLEMKSPASTTQ